MLPAQPTVPLEVLERRQQGVDSGLVPKVERRRRFDLAIEVGKQTGQHAQQRRFTTAVRTLHFETLPRGQRQIQIVEEGPPITCTRKALGTQQEFAQTYQHRNKARIIRSRPANLHRNSP